MCVILVFLALVYVITEGRNLSWLLNRTRSSNIWSANERNLGTSVKIANENSLSTDDVDWRGILYFTNACFINIGHREYLNFFLSKVVIKSNDIHVNLCLYTNINMIINISIGRSTSRNQLFLSESNNKQKFWQIVNNYFANKSFNWKWINWIFIRFLYCNSTNNLFHE